MQESQHFLVLPESLFETSAVADFTGEIPLVDIVMGADTYRFAEPVRYRIFITNTGGALLVTGNVSGTARAVCARCLDDIALVLDAPIEAYYLIPGDDEPLSEDEEVEYEVLEEGKKIDLDTLCQAAFALAMPAIPLCDEDCAGLCPRCGANLNHESCDCVEADEGDMSDSPFAVLKNYRFDAADES